VHARRRAAGTEPSAEVLAALDACPSMEGSTSRSRVRRREQYSWGDPVVAISHRRVRLRHQAQHSPAVRRARLPCHRRACRYVRREVLELEPDGVFSVERSGRSRSSDYAPTAVRAIASKGVPSSASAWASDLGAHLSALTR
jgi:carbamoyl-phosphate synthase small subunit